MRRSINPYRRINKTIRKQWSEIAHSLGFKTETKMFHSLYITRHMSTSKISKIIGFTPMCINQHLTALGFKLRSRGTNKWEEPRFHKGNTLIKKCKALGKNVTATLTIKQIAKLVNSEPSSIYSAMYRLEFPFKRKGEQNANSDKRG